MTRKIQRGGGFYRKKTFTSLLFKLKKLEQCHIFTQDGRAMNFSASLNLVLTDTERLKKIHWEIQDKKT